MHRYEFTAGDPDEPCRDMPCRKPLTVLLDEAVDLGDAIFILVNRHIPWFTSDLLDRSWADEDAEGTGQVFECRDARGPEDTFVARLRYIAPAVPRCVDTLEMVF